MSEIFKREIIIWHLLLRSEACLFDGMLLPRNWEHAEKYLKRIYLSVILNINLS